MVLGPESQDRFVSLITLTLLSIGFMCIYAVVYGSDFLIDMTLDAFVLTFVGAIAVGKYLTGKEFDE
jgi:multisubunit Na+/H+ antiporter MnhF subunit